MFSVCLAAALAQNPLIFSKGIFFISVVSPQQHWNVYRCDKPGKYLLSTSCFIIVHTQLFLLLYLVINKKNLKIYF